MSVFRITYGSVYVSGQSDELSDEQVEAMIEKVNNELELGLEGVKNNLREKFPELIVSYSVL
jgi:hypothetical protein